MRTMLRCTFPVERGNAAIKDGSLAATFQTLMDELKPEATYFYAEKGARACLMVFDMTDQAKIPQIAEPLFLNLNASIEFQPVMNAEDLKAGLRQLSAAPGA